MSVHQLEVKAPLLQLGQLDHIVGASLVLTGKAVAVTRAAGLLLVAAAPADQILLGRERLTTRAAWRLTSGPAELGR